MDVEYEFTRYDDEMGRLEIKGISIPFPMVSQRFFRGDGFATPMEVKMNRRFFVPSGYIIEDGGERYRIWKLTPQGRELVQTSQAA
tara:strand:+ start:385 stop:642 length:258 start_codon:yes stop_codon:yes gene_type:complete